MFPVYCPTRTTTVLNWPSQVIGITDVGDRLELHLRCDCRQHAVLITSRVSGGEVLHHSSDTVRAVAL